MSSASDGVARPPARTTPRPRSEASDPAERHSGVDGGPAEEPCHHPGTLRRRRGQRICRSCQRVIFRDAEN